MKTASGILILAWTASVGVCSARPAADGWLRRLASEDPTVRRRAAMALGRKAEASAVPALVTALEDPDGGVRREAAKALGFVKDERAANALIKALGDPDRGVRFYAAWALGELRDPETTDALLRALADPAYGVRDQAAWALRAIGDPAVAGRVVAALKKGKADADHALWLLRRLGGKGAVEHLAGLLEASDAAIRLKAVRALAEMDVPARVPPLVAALEDAKPAVRAVAVEALAEARDRRARQPLAKLAERETDAAIRRAAERAVLRLLMHEDLVAWWSFDDRSTEAARDVTGRGSDGRVHGCEPVPGKIGHALDFRPEAYIELGKPENLPVAGVPLTIMAWAKPRRPDGVVVARGGAFCGFSLYLKDGVARFGLHRVQDGPAYIAAGKERVVGRWVHLAGVVREDRIELYVDGRRAASAETEGYLPGNCGQPMEIGFDVGNSAAEITDHFDGLIDEVKVYHAALAGEAIAEQARVQMNE